MNTQRDKKNRIPSINKPVQKIVLTIMSRDLHFKTVDQMMKKKEQLLKIGVLSRARITTN